MAQYMVVGERGREKGEKGGEYLCQQGAHRVQVPLARGGPRPNIHSCPFFLWEAEPFPRVTTYAHPSKEKVLLHTPL